MKRILCFSWCLGISTLTTFASTTAQVCIPVSNSSPGAMEICDSIWADFNFYWNSDTVIFYAANCGNGAVYSWQFGDGATGIGRYVSHYFADTGLYKVQLMVTNNCGDTAWKYKYIRRCGSPQSIFNYRIISSNSRGFSVAFDGSLSQYANNFYWNFGDGKNSQAPLQVQHFYPHRAKPYVVYLMVDNKCGWLSKKSAEISGDIASEVPLDRELLIYPNPAGGTLYVEVPAAEQIEFKLKDLHAQVLSMNVSRNIYHYSLDLGAIKPGLYILQIRDLVSGKTEQRLIHKQ